MKTTLIPQTAAGPVSLEIRDGSPWSFTSKKCPSPDPEIEIWDITMTAKEPAEPDPFTLSWLFFRRDLQIRWSAGLRGDPILPADWWPGLSSSLAVSMPMVEIP